MKILVTGAKGFIGKNLIAELRKEKYENIYEYDVDSSLEELEKYSQDCEFVFHLAGVNRPKDESEFLKGNLGFTTTLLELLKKHNNKSPVMISSSIQAELDNPYGKSKKAGEDALLEYGKANGVKVLVYRFPNVFGKWARPNYNSAVATFSYNIARGLPITINNPDVMMSLVYIDDVIKELVKALKGEEKRKGNYCYVEPVHQVKLGYIAELLYSFKKSREERSVPKLDDPFIKKLYSNYLSYLEEDDFGYDLLMHKDHRGSFTEFLKTTDRGQVSVNISKPGITKGNHWHHTKNEKFLVVYGRGVIRFRKIGEEKVIEYYVSGEELQVIDIPVGYTHNIENLGETDMVTIMWVNEIFDPNNPDTIYEEV